VLVASDIKDGLQAALQVCHHERDMIYDEAIDIERAATWLKARLIEALELNNKELEMPLKLYEMLKATEGASSQTRENPAPGGQNNGVIRHDSSGA
jgi:hypothetical protein